MTESYGTITITDTTDLEWFYGTGILNGTGDNVNHQIVLTSNLINGAAVGSMYLDTQTSLVYKCIEVSDNSQTWQYIGNMTAGVQDEIEDASKVATNYLAVDETGIMVAELSNSEETPSTATTKNVFIDNDSVDVRDGQTVLASFGQHTIVGKANQSRIEFSSNELTGYGNHGQELFKLSGSGGGGSAELHDEILYSGWAESFPYNNQDSNYYITKTLSYTPRSTGEGMRVHFQPLSDQGDFIEVDSNGDPIQGMSTGRFFRLLTPNMDGNFSYSFYAKFLSGGGITPYTILFSYDKNTYTFSNIRAESQIYFQRYAENTTGSQDPIVSTKLEVFVEYYSYEPTPAFSFGQNNTSEMGNYSTLIGKGLASQCSYQLTIGKYNKITTDGDGTAFVIGNGSDHLNRENLLEISEMALLYNGVQIEAKNYLLVRGEATILGRADVGDDFRTFGEELTIGLTNENKTRYLNLDNQNTQVSFASNPNTGNYGLYNRTTINGSPLNKWSIVVDQNHDVYVPNGDLYASKVLYIQGKKMIYEAGDIINCFGLRCAGLLTNSGKNIEFFIPLSKPVASNLKASISGNWAIRQVGGGYLLNSATLASIGTVTITIVDLGIYVTVAASTAFSATNNTPVVVSATGNAAGTATGNSKITFSTQ